MQVLDAVKYEPFDLKLALPDGKDRSDIARDLPDAAHRLRAAGPGDNHELEARGWRRRMFAGSRMDSRG